MPLFFIKLLHFCQKVTKTNGKMQAKRSAAKQNAMKTCLEMSSNAAKMHVFVQDYYILDVKFRKVRLE